MASDQGPVSLAARRQQATTDDSTISMTASMKDAVTLVSRLEYQLMLGDDVPENILKRTLSSTTVISTASSWALWFQDAAENDSSQRFNEIGRGGCGIVFEQVGTGHVCKRAIASSPDSLWADFLVHNDVSTTFADLRPDFDIKVKVPRCLGWRGPDPVEWWLANADRFPEDFRQPGHLLFSERILPLPKLVRHALIDLYCHPSLRDGAKASIGNRHCLVRPYLGRRRRSDRYLQFFSLKNYRLHIDQMKYLRLDIGDFATQMADALAVLHWRARLDGYDVEFVLGSAPNVSVNTDAPSREVLRRLEPGTTTIPSGSGIDFEHRIVHLWIIDFNQCNEMPCNEQGVGMAVKAFFENSPYFPRPGSTSPADQELWSLFAERYLQTSYKVADEEIKAGKLPSKFIEGVVSRRKQQLDGESSKAAGGFQGPRVL